ncbi:S-methyl-5-thioribose-1-phosphate isomerase [bacterium]|nr:S-methyl-5-thioribose-1-phosphate isomerase [bacterium]MBU1920756.1 S-methyl-5-thioribose-1-phosphate isomerase [bacterium]
MRDPLNALQWAGDRLWILDQRKLPKAVVWIEARTPSTVARAIETLAVRGAPAIGIAAAYGVALAGLVRNASSKSVQRSIERLRRTRPTAFNLFDALDRMQRVLDSAGSCDPERLILTAIRYHEQDRNYCMKMARAGLKLFGKHEAVLTYCHTGALATGGIGTALGVIKHAHSKSRVKEVFACETRPVGQGARLTVWECAQSGVPVTLICDNMIGALMSARRIDRILVGADRIARNGDTSNKVGTYTLAVLAKRHKVPFHVVAPSTTFDFAMRSGKSIPIEEREETEITRIVPGLKSQRNIRIWNPAFDVTPAELITSFVTEQGIRRPPFKG